MINQLFINNVELDLDNNVVFPITYSTSDVKEPQKRKRNMTKTVVLPGTTINNSFFQSAYDLNISDVRGDSTGFDFDPTLRYPARVLRNGKEIFRGSVNLQKVVQENGINQFHIVLYSDITDLFQSLGDIKISELGWSEYDHILSVANIQASWDSPTGSGYVYPLIDFGFTDDPIRFKTNELRPYVYVQEVVEKCFERLGYTLSGGFFSSALNRKLIFGTGGGEILKLSLAEATDRIVDYDGTGLFSNDFDPSSVIEGGEGTVISNFSYINTFNFSDNDSISITLSQDNLAQMDEGSGEIVIANSGNYRFEFISNIDLSYSFTEVVSDPNFRFRVTLEVLRNESIIFSEVHLIGSVVGGVEPILFAIGEDLFLNTSDILKVRFRVNSELTVCEYVDVNKLDFDFTLNSSNLLIESIDEDITDGDTVNLSRFLPDMRAQDFLSDMITLFNLYLNDPDEEGRILFVPIDDFYFETDDVDQWSEKMDRGKKIEIMPAANIQGKTYSFEWAKDRDYYKQLFFETYGQNELDYGDKNYDVPSTFKVGTKKYQLKIAQSVPVQIEGTDIIIPHIYKKNEASGVTSPHKGKPRMFFYSGKRDSDNWYLVNSDTGVETLFDVYPVAHHLDDIDSPTFDLNFDVPYWVYYTATSYTNNNCFSNYHAQFIRELTSKDSKILNAYFDLNEDDLYNNFMRRLCNVDGVLYRKNIVKEYRATSNETTKVELVKIVAANSRKNYLVGTSPGFEPNTDGVFGGGDSDSGGGAAGLARNTTISAASSMYIMDATSKDVTVTLDNSYLKTGKEFTIVLEEVSNNNKLIIDTTQFTGGSIPFKPKIGGSSLPIELFNKNDSITLKFDGANYQIVSSSVGFSEDHHSGYNTINTNETVVISSRKQMTNWNKLTINGTLDVQGDLILK